MSFKLLLYVYLTIWSSLFLVYVLKAATVSYSVQQ